MISVTSFLGILISILTIILLVVLIYLAYRLIQIVDKTDRILNNVEKKVNSLNSLFNVIDRTSLGINSFTNKLARKMTDLFGRVFKRKKEEDDFYE